MPISDEMLNSLGEWYNSEFVIMNVPWIRQITFEEWVTRVMAERGVILQ
jgi:hypothetical protein